MTSRRPMRLFSRMGLIWCIFTALTLVWGDALVRLLHLPIEALTEWLSDGFIVAISEQPSAEGAGNVIIHFHAFEPVLVAGDISVTPWTPMTAAIDAGHDLMPAAMLLACALSTPFISVRRMLVSAARALLAAVALLVVVVGLHFSGLIEISLQRAAESVHQARPESLTLTIFEFAESGGTWMVALGVAALVAWSSSARDNRRNADSDSAETAC